MNKPYRDRAIFLQKKGLHSEAEKIFKNLLLESPADHDLLFRLATLYLETQRGRHAIPLLDRILTTSPPALPALALLARAHASVGNTREAIYAINNALAKY